jgi:hypothetical protein
MGNVHVKNWTNLLNISKEKKVNIVNCSQISKITCFNKSNLLDELQNF